MFGFYSYGYFTLITSSLSVKILNSYLNSSEMSAVDFHNAKEMIYFSFRSNILSLLKAHSNRTKGKPRQNNSYVPLLLTFQATREVLRADITTQVAASQGALTCKWTPHVGLHGAECGRCSHESANRSRLF